MKTRRPTRSRQAGILDVAAKADVSPATVSRYFNHPDLVRYDTRNRIASAVEALGYVRNRAASSLNRGRTGAVGLIVPTVDNAIFAELIQAFGDTLNAAGRALLLSTHGYDLSAETFLTRAFLEHQVDGVVLVGARHDEATYDLLAQHDIPVLTVWNWQRTARVPCIGISNRELGRLAARHLVELGHTDIACLFPDASGNDRAGDRRKGALSALASSGHAVPPDRQLSCPYDIVVAKDLVRGILSSDKSPTAILAGNDIIAQAAIHAAHSISRSVPKHVSVIGVGDFRGSAAIEPGLTTIRIPARTIGNSAAGAIIDLINGDREPADISRRVRPELIVRGSTAPPTS